MLRSGFLASFGLLMTRLATTFLFVWLCAGGPAAAQTTAVLQGRIFDSSGSLLPGASVQVRDEASGFSELVLANAGGQYAVAAIPAGTYAVEVSAMGHRSEVIAQLTPP